MRKRTGSTLIEVMVAMGVISIGLFTAANLVFSNLNLVDRDADAVMAVNLARESLEIAKHLRDSNWLENIPFDTGMVDLGADGVLVPDWSGDVSEVEPLFATPPVDELDPKAAIVKMDSGMWANAVTATGTPTVFRRTVKTSRICMDASGVESVLTWPATCPGGSSYVGLRILSRVSWNRRGRSSTVEIYGDLYDWK